METESPVQRNIDYLGIFFPVPHRVAGKVLSPLTIGHLLFLEYYELDYRITNKNDPKLSDVYNTVMSFIICSRTWKQNRRFAYLNSHFPRIAKLIYQYNRWKLGGWKGDFISSNSELMAYFQYHLQNYPETYLTPTQEKYAKPNEKKGSPFLLALVTLISSHFNETVARFFDVEHPLDISFDGSQWLLAVKAEAEGTTTLHDSSDIPDAIKDIDKALHALPESERFKAFQAMPLPGQIGKEN